MSSKSNKSTFFNSVSPNTSFSPNLKILCHLGLCGALSCTIHWMVIFESSEIFDWNSQHFSHSCDITFSNGYQHSNFKFFYNVSVLDHSFSRWSHVYLCKNNNNSNYTRSVGFAPNTSKHQKIFGSMRLYKYRH